MDVKSHTSTEKGKITFTVETDENNKRKISDIII